MIEELGYSRSKVKPAAAWIAEKLGRLKLNGQLRGYSPLSRLIELEGLLIGITGKIGLWQTLTELGVGEDLDADLEQLTARAAAQRAAVDDLHRLAVLSWGAHPLPQVDDEKHQDDHYQNADNCHVVPSDLVSPEPPPARVSGCVPRAVKAQTVKRLALFPATGFRRPFALGARHLLGDDGTGQRLDLALEELRHPFLLAPDPFRQFRRLSIADSFGEGLDRQVGGDLLVLVEVLGLGVLRIFSCSPLPRTMCSGPFAAAITFPTAVCVICPPPPSFLIRRSTPWRVLLSSPLFVLGPGTGSCREASWLCAVWASKVVSGSRSLP